MGLAQVQTAYSPKVLEEQGWIITAVAAGLGITRIMLWFRNGSNGTKPSIERIEIANLDKVLSTVSHAVNQLTINQNRLIDQEEQAEHQRRELARALDELRVALLEIKATLKRLDK